MISAGSYLRLLIKILQFIVEIVYYSFESIYYIFGNQKEKSVSGEIVLITGSGHGIGKELAIQYANLNATVVCLDINKITNEQTVDEIKRTIKSPNVYAYTCDVSNRENIFAVADKIKKDIGDVTILINNAGIMPCHAFLDQTVTQIKQTFDINIMAHIWMLQAYLPSMIENNHGHIVALSSIAGLSGIPYLSPYCATKFAVRGFMEAMSDELRLSSNGKSLIKFTTIFPYMVDTGLCKNPRIDENLPFMTLESPKIVAAKIIKAQRQDMFEKTIPSFWLSVTTYGRLLPTNGIISLKNFLNSGLVPDS